MTSLSIANRLSMLLLSLIIPGVASAVTDQVSLPGISNLNANSPYSTWQQQVQTGITGKLTSVTLFFEAQTGVSFQSFQFFVNKGEGWQTDANDFSAIISPTAGQVLIDTSIANLTFAVGERFMIGVHGLGPSNGCCTLLAATDSYASGMLFSGPNTPQGSGQYDLAFITTVASVPEPAVYSSMFLGLALIGGALRRRIYS